MTTGAPESKKRWCPGVSDVQNHFGVAFQDTESECGEANCVISSRPTTSVGKTPSSMFSDNE